MQSQTIIGLSIWCVNGEPVSPQCHENWSINPLVRIAIQCHTSPALLKKEHHGTVSSTKFPCLWLPQYINTAVSTLPDIESFLFLTQLHLLLRWMSPSPAAIANA